MNKEIPQDYQAVSVDFQQINNDTFTSYDRLLQWFCTEITSKLQLQNTPAEFLQGVRRGNMECTNYFEEYLLREIQPALVLVLYNVEVILQNQAMANDFFGWVRAWHQNVANNNSWEKLRFVIVHSKDINTNPPFNVGVVIEFPDPDAGQ